MHPESTARLPVLLVGAGAIGRMHAQRLRLHPQLCLAGVAEPAQAGRALAAEHGVPWAPQAEELLARLKPAAAIVATPNATHLAVGRACLDAGAALLMEKPVADTVEDALALVRLAQQRGVPLLVGHQRRHNPITRRARELVAAGALGRPLAAQVQATWLKPEAYFEAGPWRKRLGGGPVLINLIHDVDLLRHVLADEVVQVQAMASSAARGLEVEDTAAVLLRFAGGTLATLLTSDSTVAPWNWDPGVCAAENMARAETRCRASLGARPRRVAGATQAAGNDGWPYISPRPCGLPRFGRAGVVANARRATWHGCAWRLAIPAKAGQRGPCFLPRRLLTAGEAAHYPRQAVDALHFSGTEGSLTLPGLQLWRYPGARGWHEELQAERRAVHTLDPYMEQLSHLREVAEGRAAPLCSGLDGARTLQATQAVLQAAASGQAVALAPLNE